MSFTKLAVKLAVPAPKPDSFQSYLFIGPHPDDIEIGCGALISRLTKEHKKVSFLICTDGRFGDGKMPDKTGDELAEIRKEECLASAALLRVTDVHFLGLSDGAFYSFDEMVRGIAKVVGELQPEILFAPDHLSRSESHEDHLNTGKAARKVACFAPYPKIMEGLGATAADVKAIAYYMTASPNRFVKTSGHFDTQLQAILKHQSQYEEKDDEFSSLKLYLTLRAREYGIRSFHQTAEGYRVLGKTQLHCVPEA